VTQDMDARKWLAALPDSLAGQRDTLLRLLDAVERNPQWRWLELGCSLAQGRVDSGDLLRAARVCAALLGDLSSEAAETVGGTAPQKIGAFVRERLDCITTTTSCGGGLDEVAG
jgi:hypothetical protein